MLTLPHRDRTALVRLPQRAPIRELAETGTVQRRFGGKSLPRTNSGGLVAQEFRGPLGQLVSGSLDSRARLAIRLDRVYGVLVTMQKCRKVAVENVRLWGLGRVGIRC